MTQQRDAHTTEACIFMLRVPTKLKTYFSPVVWAMQMRQQREIIGKHAMHFLAGYISMFSGQGPFQTGITRYVVL